MRFANPIFLLLLGFIPFYIWFSYIRKKNRSAILYSDIKLLEVDKDKNLLNREKILFWMRIAAFALAVIALARPQAGQFSQDVSNEGIDIVICLDTSTSMRAEDFKPNNRFFVARETSKQFVKMRKHDRIGIVVFAGLSFTQCPLSIDHAAVLELLDKTDIGMTQVDATAIGSAIATAVNRLKSSQAKSKVIIVLSDGRNNAGEIDPITASKVAQVMGIKIYTIGAGAPGPAIYPIDDPVFGRRYVQLPQELDEDTLRKISDTTGGMYFRATSAKALENVFRQIDKMEKTKIKTTEYSEYRDLYLLFLLPAFLLLLLEQVLVNTVFMKIP